MKKQFKVEEMHCNHCVESIDKALKDVEGIENIDIDLDSKIVSLEGEVDDEKVIESLDEIGFDAVSL
ncbi:MAG: heavy-metal-associated domain-containing protein [Finegoldia sp.]|nr:heavy-metal-associated domain-containing protein [Finegoldia sp.]